MQLDIHAQLECSSLKSGRQAPEKEASSQPLPLFSVAVPLLMVRRDAAGDGVLGLDGADTPTLFALLFSSDLQGTASLLASWVVLIICAHHTAIQLM